MGDILRNVRSYDTFVVGDEEDDADDPRPGTARHLRENRRGELPLWPTSERNQEINAALRGELRRRRGISEDDGGED